MPLIITPPPLTVQSTTNERTSLNKPMPANSNSHSIFGGIKEATDVATCVECFGSLSFVLPSLSLPFPFFFFLSFLSPFYEQAAPQSPPDIFFSL